MLNYYLLTSVPKDDSLQSCFPQSLDLVFHLSDRALLRMIIITGSLPCDYFITSSCPTLSIILRPSVVLVGSATQFFLFYCNTVTISFLRISTISAIIKKTMITFPTHCYNTKAPDWNYMIKIAEDK